MEIDVTLKHREEDMRKLMDVLWCIQTVEEATYALGVLAEKLKDAGCPIDLSKLAEIVDSWANSLDKPTRNPVKLGTSK